MNAEDLSQEILFDIMKNINKGINIENLDYYIWQVCKNHYSKYVGTKVKERESISFVEEISESADNTSILDDMMKDEKVRMINASIKLLSKDYAEILYSYYVEDRTLLYIADKLQLPLGMVKRRLFDIRNRLKEYLKMERLNGKKAFVPKRFGGVRSGGGEIDPHQYIDSLINKNILFHSYDNPCLLEDYSLELGISIPYIEEIVSKLTYATLLKKEGNKYITNFPIIDLDLDKKLRNTVKDEVKVYGEKLAMFAKKHFYKFKEIVNNDHFDDNQLMWVFMFIINRYAEQFPINSNEMVIQPKFRHTDSKGSWDFYMIEHSGNVDGYVFSENWFGNHDIGIQGMAFRCSWIKEHDELFSTLDFRRSINKISAFELQCLEYVVKNFNTKYSQIEANNKYKVDFLLDNNYLYLEGDDIKFNFVLLSKTQHEQIKANYQYHDELKEVKEQRNKILEELKKIIMNVIPIYLYDDLNNLLLGYLAM